MTRNYTDSDLVLFSYCDKLLWQAVMRYWRGVECNKILSISLTGYELACTVRHDSKPTSLQQFPEDLSADIIVGSRDSSVHSSQPRGVLGCMIEGTSVTGGPELMIAAGRGPSPTA
jgi:hypothetical protein